MGYADEPDGFYVPDVFEQTTASRFLVVAGRAVTSVSRAQLSGTLDEAIGLLPPDQPHRAPIVSCRSTDHQFTLAR